MLPSSFNYDNKKVSFANLNLPVCHNSGHCNEKIAYICLDE